MIVKALAGTVIHKFIYKAPDIDFYSVQVGDFWFLESGSTSDISLSRLCFSIEGQKTPMYS